MEEESFVNEEPRFLPDDEALSPPHPLSPPPPVLPPLPVVVQLQKQSRRPVVSVDEHGEGMGVLPKQQQQQQQQQQKAARSGRPKKSAGAAAVNQANNLKNYYTVVKGTAAP